MFNKKTVKRSLAMLLLCAAFLCVTSSADSAQKKNIGILFLHAGTADEYAPDWIPQYFNGLFDFFDPGFFAGGPLEGKTCYTLIHYANEAEAAICGVEEGTTIDVFCNQYAGSYPIHTLIDHLPAELGGDGGFEEDCFAPGIPIPWAPLAFGHSTIEPKTGAKIWGPHVDDPAGAGIGIADFLELDGFSLMELYSREPNNKIPYRKQLEKWWFGNDAPDYPPDGPELLNIKDRLQELMPQYRFVYRRAWDTYRENVDIYGKPRKWPDSIETAIDELINKEKVEKIIVSFPEVLHANLTQYGHDWYDNNDAGISTVPGKTFKECVQDINDGAGPAATEDLNAYLSNKPWEKHWKHPLPLAKYFAETNKATIDLRFTRAFGNFEEYESAVLAMLEYTISKYNISKDSALKVILAQYGYYTGYKNAQACDCYYRMADDVATRARKRIKDNFSWDGKFELGTAPFKYSEGSTFDPPGTDKPFGNVISVGETIDTSINGTYVNALGETIDNGMSNFDTIIVLHGYFFTDDTDVWWGTREEALGNNIFSQNSYARDKADADGTKYNPADIDEEGFTVKVFDGTGWPGPPGCLKDPNTCSSNSPVYKGSKDKPTRVILCGTFLGNNQGVGRELLVEAGAKAIIEAINLPDIVDLNFFRAAPRNSAVKLTWVTSNEAGNKGFNMYRASSADGAYEKVNDELIPSQGGSGSLERYQFIDKNLENGTKYFYMVEAVKNPVRTRKYGPAVATPRLIWGILPQ